MENFAEMLFRLHDRHAQHWAENFEPMEEENCKMGTT